MSDLAVQKFPLDFGAGLSDAIEELAGGVSQVTNILKDPGGYIRLGPGTSAWSWFPAIDPTDDPTPAHLTGGAIIGITEFNGAVVYVTADRKIWALSAPGLVSALSDATAATQLQGNQPPIFAATRSRLFIAGGGLMQYWTGAGLSARVDNGPIASHVVGNSDRVVASHFDNTGQFSWTEASEGNHLSAAGWDPTNFATAEARPDRVVALHENSDEIFLFGTRTVQIFQPDPNVAYSPAYTLNQGTTAPYSIVNVLEKRSFAWLTEDREFVLSTARDDPAFISRPDITRTIKGLATVDDCQGAYWKLGNHRLLAWRFPTAGVTFAYDIDAKRWLRLSGYDSTLGDFAPWPITSSYYWPEQNVHLAGLSTGEVAKLDMDSVSVAGQALIGRTRLGYSSNGTEGPKQTLTLRAPIKRGLGSLGATNPPFVELRWSDRPGNWSKPLILSLGAAESNRPEIVKRIVTRPYVRRAWEITIGAGVGVSIGPIEATTELLED